MVARITKAMDRWSKIYFEYFTRAPYIQGPLAPATRLLLEFHLFGKIYLSVSHHVGTNNHLSSAKRVPISFSILKQ